MTTAIKGWRERAGLPASYEITNPSAVERALLDEGADLRAQIARLVEALQVIAGGDGDAMVIAQQTLLGEARA